MLSAYVALAHQLYPDISYYKLFAASSIVVLVASFPISLNGWGIRELGAAYIYGFLGISSDAGIVIGTIIGLLSLAALFTGVLISHKLGKEPVVSNLGEGQTKRMELSLYRVISRISPLCVAALVLFQIKLPTEQGLINVNLADPIAIVCGLMMAFMYFNGVFKEGIWNSSQFKLCLWAVTIIFAISFLYGYSRYGMIDWALYNRLFGWGVLLSYLLTGALIVSSAGLPGLLMLVRVFVTALAAIVFFDLSLDFIKSVSGTEILPLRHTRLAGFTGNPNAFSLQLVFALIILISFKKYITTKIVKRFDLVLLALIIAGIWLTASRAAYITSLVLIIIFALFRWVELKRMTLGFCGAVVLIVINSINFKSASILIGELIANGFTFGPNSFLTTTFGRLVHAEQMVVNEADRWESLWAGVELFLANPWFGAGLGAYMHAQLQETGVPFVIHRKSVV